MDRVWKEKQDEGMLQNPAFGGPDTFRCLRLHSSCTPLNSASASPRHAHFHNAGPVRSVPTGLP